MTSPHIGDEVSPFGGFVVDLGHPRADLLGVICSSSFSLDSLSGSWVGNPTFSGSYPSLGEE
jgi:hypothetical protein